MFGLSHREKLLAVVPAGSVVVSFKAPYCYMNKKHPMSKEQRLWILFVKCTNLCNARCDDCEIGIFKFQFNYTGEYLEVIIREGFRQLHLYYRYNRVVAAAKSHDDLEMLSTMALMVL